MKKKTLQILFIVFLVIGLATASIWYVKSQGNSSPNSEPQNSSATPISALVQTQPLIQENMAQQVQAEGEVIPSLLTTISAAHAGQIAQLQVIQGQRVQRGSPLVTLTGDPSVHMAYLQAASALAFAKNELKRMQDLYALQLATQSQVDSAQRALHDAQAAVQAQKDVGGQEMNTVIKAPFDGVVLALNVVAGDRVQAGASLMQLGKLDTVRIDLGIEPADSSLIKVGMPVTLIANNSSNNTSETPQKAQGKIAQIQNLIDPKTRLVHAIATLPAHEASSLLLGTHIRATIEVGSRELWVVPHNAVLNDEQGDYVYQVQQGKALRVGVKRELEKGEHTGISGALNPRAPVIVLGNYEVQDGMPVREARP